MQNSEPFVWYGTIVLFVMAGFIIVPFLRGKGELLSAWNILLLGIIIFVAGGSFEVRYGEWNWPQLQWFQPTVREVQWCILATTVFLVALFLSYYYNPVTKAIARRAFRTWPPNTQSLQFFVLVSCVGLATLSLPLKNVTFIGQVLFQLSHKALVFASVFSFAIWWRHRSNLLWLGVFFGVFCWASVFAMLVFLGRRLLLSIFFGPVLMIYWSEARLWRPTRTMLVIGAFSVGILFVSVAYNQIRLFSIGKDKQERTVGNVLKQVKSIGGTGFAYVISNKLHYFGQSAMHYSLLTERYVKNGQLEPKLFNTFRFIAAYPVPRKIWPEKPESIGETLVRDVVGYSHTNWGCGIAAHGSYEGGLLAMVLYGIMFAFIIQLFDEPLRAQPTNLFLIASLAAAAPHVLSIARGDFGIMANEILECFLFTYALGLVCRFVYGIDRSKQTRRTFNRADSLMYGTRA